MLGKQCVTNGSGERKMCVSVFLFVVISPFTVKFFVSEVFIQFLPELFWNTINVSYIAAAAGLCYINAPTF